MQCALGEAGTALEFRVTYARNESAHSYHLGILPIAFGKLEAYSGHKTNDGCFRS